MNMEKLTVAMKKGLVLLIVCMIILLVAPSSMAEDSPSLETLQVYVDGDMNEYGGVIIDDQPYFQMLDIAKLFSASEKPLRITYDSEAKIIAIQTDGPYQKVTTKIPAEAVVELDATPLSLSRTVVGKACYYNLTELAQALNVSFEIDQDSGTYHVWTDRISEGKAPSELDRAIAYGLITEDLQGNYNRTITHKEDAELLAQMISVYSGEDTAKIDAWKKTSDSFSWSTGSMHRSEGMIQILLASTILGLNDMTIDWTLLNNIMGEPWDKFIVDDTLYSMVYDQVSLLNGDVWQLDAASYFVSFGRTSAISGKLLFDYDEKSNSMRTQDPLTRLEAIEAALRLYESGTLGEKKERVISKQEQDILIAAEEKKQAVINSATDITVSGTTYYVSNEGDDNNDGLTPATPWETLEKVNGGIGTVEGAKILETGDAVLFRRGDIFRGQLIAKKEITYSTYGEGDKPVISLSPENGSGSQKWSLVDGSDHTWVFYKDITDCGAMLLNNSEIAQKTCAYWDGTTYQSIGMDGSLTKFDLLTLNDGWFFNDIDYGDEFSTDKTGKLYFRCDEGNPGEVYTSIEFFACSLNPWNAGFVTVYDNAIVDNLCFLYGAQGIGAHDANGATIQNCEVGWMGGMLLDFSYEALGGNSVAAIVRSGDGIMAGGRNIVVRNNYIHHTWDHALTVEAYAEGRKPGNTSANKKTWYRTNITFEGNISDYCYGGITIVDWYACSKNVKAPIFTDINVLNNDFLNNGYGWSHLYGNDISTSFGVVNIGYTKGSEGITFTNNVFYLTKKGVMGPLINFTPCPSDAQLPVFLNNTYIQNQNQPLICMNNKDGSPKEIYMQKENINAALETILSESNPTLIQ